MNLPFYDEADVKASILMPDAIHAMRNAFIALSNGSAIVPK